MFFTVILTQGLNRQNPAHVRVPGFIMFTKLRRVRIMNVTLQNLPVGKWRELTVTEMAAINESIAKIYKKLKKLRILIILMKSDFELRLVFRIYLSKPLFCF